MDEGTRADQEAVRRDIRRLGRVSGILDDFIRLPGGYRIGLDGLIGLIPGAGDAVGALLSSYIIANAARLGVSTAILVRMIYNVLVETVLGTIPVLGDLFDFAWKSNRRNMALLESHIGESSRGEAGHRRLWWLLIALISLVILGTLALAWAMLAFLMRLASG